MYKHATTSHLGEENNEVQRRHMKNIELEITPGRTKKSIYFFQSSLAMLQKKSHQSIVRTVDGKKLFISLNKDVGSGGEGHSSEGEALSGGGALEGVLDSAGAGR